MAMGVQGITTGCEKPRYIISQRRLLICWVKDEYRYRSGYTGDRAGGGWPNLTLTLIGGLEQDAQDLAHINSVGEGQSLSFLEPVQQPL